MTDATILILPNMVPLSSGSSAVFDAMGSSGPGGGGGVGADSTEGLMSPPSVSAAAGRVHLGVIFFCFLLLQSIAVSDFLFFPVRVGAGAGAEAEAGVDSGAGAGAETEADLGAGAGAEAESD